PDAPPLTRPRRHRPRPRAERRPRRLGRRAHHADVRALGLLRRRALVRLLSAAREGPRPLDPPRRRGPGPRPARARRAAASPVRPPGLDRGAGGDGSRRGPRAALAPPSLEGKRGERGTQLGGPRK